MRLLKNIFYRGWALFVLVAVAFFVCTNYAATIHSAQLQTLSRLSPAYDYNILMAPRPVLIKELAECVYYHRRVVDFVPSAAAEAWSMIGYCSARMGRDADALDAFKRAIDKNPSFFWNYYNRGVIYYNRGDFESAGESFLAALNANPQATVYALMKSKVFTDIKRSFAHPYDVQTNLAAAYLKTSDMAKVSRMCRDRRDMPFCKNNQEFQVRMF